MKTKFVLMVLIVVAVLGGCIPLSLNPFYNDKDITFDPALVGLWGEKGENTRVSIQKEGDNSYCLIDLNADSTVKYDLHLFTIEGKRFLDLHPRTTGARDNDLLDMHLIRGHSLLRVDQITPTLVTAGFSAQWLEEQFSKNPQAMPHVMQDDQVILTAATVEMQAFIYRHLNEEGIFDTPSEMIRIEQK
jgi:hypothetical protein